MKGSDPKKPSLPDCAGRRFAIVVARFYAGLSEQLVDGARRGLRDCGVGDADVNLFEVPGCFELPLACRNVIDTDRFDAIVALGIVIKGETPHFEYVAGECARGIMKVQLDTGIPIGFGVLTTDDILQAEQRADPKGGDKGYSAAIAAASVLMLTAGQPRAGFRK